MTVTPEQDAAEPNAAELILSLSNFSLSEVLEGFYPHGESPQSYFTVQRSDGTRYQPRQQYERQEPSHKLIVNADWSYARESEKLVLDGREVTGGGVHFYLGDATDDAANAARREFLLIDVPAVLFEPLVNSVQRGDIAKATLHLDAEPRGSWSHLVFKRMEIARREPTRPVTLSDLPSEFKAAFRQLQLTLYVIAILLFFVLIELWRH